MKESLNLKLVYIWFCLYFFSFFSKYNRKNKKWIVKKDIHLYINDNKVVMKLGPILLIDSSIQLMIQI
jgi:hypothetical protein